MEISKEVCVAVESDYHAFLLDLDLARGRLFGDVLVVPKVPRKEWSVWSQVLQPSVGASMKLSFTAECEVKCFAPSEERL
jgi:hypothetical protein